ncbi:PIG-L deacetylase family protein [Flavimarina sp. Hel_I_48]|uniref:PIG-L deacetylase family protein n=1 Tax=Flavimarina sp. Hel_I_48 TaxID=1392488 RepID=UPI00068F3E17|nr:PIG-L family deacetylase [Flavimarina sp. Hel_I_48]
MNKKQKILLISPHLDDAVFSVGGIAAELAAQGTEVSILTCFTQSVKNPTGFALACQLDKNLPADVDYMELRRLEDQKACQLLGIKTYWGDLPEAPHRGYTSAKELFQDLKKQDTIAEKLLPLIEKWIEEIKPGLVLYPKGIGNHVDHQQVCNVMQQLKKRFATINYLQWYDQPYLMRNPDSLTENPIVQNKVSVEILKGLFKENSEKPILFDLKSVNMLKFQACAAYESQVNFQFNSADKLAGYFIDSAEGEMNFLELLSVG